MQGLKGVGLKGVGAEHPEVIDQIKSESSQFEKIQIEYGESFRI
jgi:hypothetical protein